MSPDVHVAEHLKQPLFVGQTVVRKSLTSLVSKDAVCSKIQEMLASASANEVYRSEDYIWFRGGIRPVFNTNILNSLHVGWIRVDENKDGFNIAFTASTFQMMALSLCLAFFLASMPFFGSLRHGKVPEQGTLLFVGFFAAFFGGNYLIARFRFPRWIRRGLEQAEPKTHRRP